MPGGHTGEGFEATLAAIESGEYHEWLDKQPFPPPPRRGQCVTHPSEPRDDCGQCDVLIRQREGLV